MTPEELQRIEATWPANAQYSADERARWPANSWVTVCALLQHIREMGREAERTNKAASDQSTYIQTEGLSPYERAGLEGKIEEQAAEIERMRALEPLKLAGGGTDE